MSQPTTPLPCPNCATPIDLSTAEWCHCVSKTPSFICPSCRNCFCNVSAFPMSGELLEHQTAEKFRRALDASSESSPNGLTVLIVDDDEEIRLIAEYSVQQMGYRTLSAANAEEALRILKGSRPDVVLTDALMPNIDGRRLCRMIKKVDPSIKVIVMSALSRSAQYLTETLQTFQADEFLAKPINFDKLRQVLGTMSQRAA
jgi:two-component system response regulator (stage 0 sporulation protein F)